MVLQGMVWPSDLGVVSAGRVDGLSHDVQVVFGQHGWRVVDALSRPVEGCRQARRGTSMHHRVRSAPIRAADSSAWLKSVVTLESCYYGGL